MNVFAIIRVQNEAKMKAALEEHFSKNFHDLGNKTWLVASSGSAKELSDKLGVTAADDSTPTGPAIIVRFEDYFGRGPRPTWDWIKEKLEESDDRAS